MPSAHPARSVSGPHAYQVLPFCAAPAGEGAIFWAPRPSGDYVSDCALGRQYGHLLLPWLGSHPWLLGTIMVHMMQHGDAAADQGVVVGLAHVLATRLAAHPLRP